MLVWDRKHFLQFLKHFIICYIISKPFLFTSHHKTFLLNKTYFKTYLVTFHSFLTLKVNTGIEPLPFLCLGSSNTPKSILKWKEHNQFTLASYVLGNLFEKGWSRPDRSLYIPLQGCHGPSNWFLSLLFILHSFHTLVSKVLVSKVRQLHF